MNLLSEMLQSNKISFSIRKFLLDALFPAIALLLLWGWFLSNSIKGNGSFALFEDNEFFIGPIFNSIGQSLKSFELPLRMDNLIGGLPLYNFTQFSPLYPLYFTYLPIFERPADIIYSMHWITLFHLLIFEINTYILLRVIGTSKFASLMGAALVTFSANSFNYAYWVNITAPYAWFPFYIAGIIGILKFQGRTRYVLMALIGIVLLTYASPSQPLIHSIFVTIIFVCSYAIDRFRSGDVSKILYPVGKIAFVAILAFLLSAPAILPALLEFKNMIRWIGEFPPVVGNSPIPFEAFQVAQLSFKDLSGVIFKLKTLDVGSQFIGIITIMLASFAARLYSRSWIVVAFIFISLYSLASSMGINLGFAYINYYIPIINKIREPSRFLVLFQFAVGILAAVGIDVLFKLLTEKLKDKEKISKKWFLLLLLPLIALLIYLGVKGKVDPNASPQLSLAASFVLVSLTIACVFIRHQWINRLTVVLWGISALMFLGIEIPWTSPPIEASFFLGKGGPPMDIAIQRVASFDPGRDYRVLFDGRIVKREGAMIASYRKVRTLNSFFNPAPKSQFEEMTYFKAEENNYFRILGAKYLICRECTADSIKGYKFIESVSGYELYEAEDVLPHSYIVYRTNGDFSSLGEFKAKAAGQSLSKGILFYESNVSKRLPSDDGTAVEPCNMSEKNRLSNHMRFILQCENPGVLIINEFFEKSWTAKVDGVKVKPLKVNGNQIGIPLPVGSHIIEMRYLPTNFVISIGLMILGFILLLTFLAKKCSDRIRTELTSLT